jgi:hypothetical protein
MINSICKSSVVTQFVTLALKKQEGCHEPKISLGSIVSTRASLGYTARTYLKVCVCVCVCVCARAILHLTTVEPRGEQCGVPTMTT